MTASGTIERAEFTVVYEGEALREHRMSVRELAPALLAIADLYQHANEVLNPGEPQVSLDIKATDDGSFMVDLVLLHDVVVDALTSPDAAALGALMGFIGGGAGLFNWIKHRKQGKQDQLPNGSVRITYIDGAVIEFPPEVVRLGELSMIRRDVRAVIAPLDHDGIDEFQVRPRPRAEPDVRITSEDAEAVNGFIDDDRGPLLTDQTFEQSLLITSPTFQAGNKWRLNDGQATYWMAMDDMAFVDRIDKGEIAFRKNDRLRARVRLRQWEGPNGDIHTERTVTRVLTHVEAAEQTALFRPDRPLPSPRSEENETGQA